MISKGTRKRWKRVLVVLNLIERNVNVLGLQGGWTCGIG